MVAAMDYSFFFFVFFLPDCFFNHHHIFDVQGHTCVLTTCVINPLLRALIVEHQGDYLVNGVFSYLS